MRIPELDTVCFVGAGTMGCANSLMAAISGYDVVLHDLRPESLDAVEARQDGMASFIVQNGVASTEDVAAGRKRISLASDLAEATASADLVSESVFEDLDLKRRIHRQLDEIAPSHTLLTTNSSTLQASEIEDVVRRGALFAALHSHLGSPLFDIVAGPRTAPTTIDVLRRYVLSLGGVPLVLKKEHPGYVFNAINGRLLATALRLRLAGRATIEEIDRAWMTDRGAPMGPFGMMDLFGLDLILDSWRRPSDDASREALRAEVIPFLTGYVEEGMLGQKSARGFYAYPEPAFRASTFLAETAESRLASDALLGALVQTSVSLVAQEVASRADVDLAWTAATGLDVGPFGIIEQLGIEAVLQILQGQVAAGLLTQEAVATTESCLREQGSL